MWTVKVHSHCVPFNKNSSSKEVLTHFTVRHLEDKKPLATEYPEAQNDPPPAVEGEGDIEESQAAPRRSAANTSIAIGLYSFSLRIYSN